MVQCVLFDLDFCLFVAELEMRGFKGSKDHLTEVQVDGLAFKHYAIHLEIMAQIFKALQAKGVVIGFVTAGAYDPTTIKSFFEKIYGLEADSLKEAPFIGGKDFGGPYVQKGVKVDQAQAQGLIKKGDQVIAREDITVVDDSVRQIESAKFAKYNGILALGYPNQRDDIVAARNDYYLRELIEKFGLDIKLPEDINTSVKSPYTPLLTAYHARQRQVEDMNRDAIAQQQAAAIDDGACTCLNCAKCLAMCLLRTFCCCPH